MAIAHHARSRPGGREDGRRAVPGPRPRHDRPASPDAFEAATARLKRELGAVRAAAVAEPAPTEAGIAPAKRALVVRAEPDDRADLRRRVRETLGDASDETVGAVTEDLRAAQATANILKANFLKAGRALIRLQEHAGPGGYVALLRAGLVPFTEAQASKLRTVAAAVDGERLPVAAMPTSLEPAYAAAKLAQPERERLIEGGVIRPGASRREIEDASRPTSRAAPAGGTLTRERRRELERLRDRLLARVAAIEELLAAG